MRPAWSEWSTTSLANAIKYSPDGGPVRVRVSREPVHVGARDQEWAVVSIQDVCIGIPSGNLPLVFEHFHRGRNIGTSVDGTGIGLSGAKQLVEQHGGRIEIASEEGRGTLVRVWLPLGEGS